MKIGIYDPYLDDLGGGEKYMLSVAQCLSKQHNVTFFWESEEEFKIAKDRFSIDISRVKLSTNIFSPKVSFIKRFLETRKYDAIIFLSDGSIPIVGSKRLFIHVQMPIKALENLSFRDRLKIRKVNKFFFNSFFTQSYMGNLIKNRGVIVHPPINIYPENIKKENVILSVGRFRAKNAGIENYKKLDVMIGAFKELINKGLKGWKLILAVSVNEKDKEKFKKLEGFAKNYPIEFLINEKNIELWDAYNSAKIYWHAAGFGENLEKHPEFAEHFGISTVEAMAAGAVPVVINAGGQKEIVENGINGFLWDSLNELEIKTNELIKDDVLWKRISEKATQRSKFFAGDRFCKEIKEIIK